MSHIINRSHNNRDDSKSGTRFYTGRRIPHCVLLSPASLLEILAVFLLSYRKTDPPLLLPPFPKSEKNPFGYCCIKGFFSAVEVIIVSIKKEWRGRRRRRKFFAVPFVGVNTTSQTTGKGGKEKCCDPTTTADKEERREAAALPIPREGVGLNKSVVVKGARPKSNLSGGGGGPPFRRRRRVEEEEPR